MSGADATARFERVLRGHTPALEADEELDFSAPLGSLGLDSVEIVGLLVSLEEEFGVLFPPELMTPETFASAGSLWAGLSDHLDRTAA